MTLKVTLDCRKWRDSIDCVFDRPSCEWFSDNVAILHRFRHITALSVYMTGCDLENSFSFDTRVEITGHVR